MQQYSSHLDWKTITQMAVTSRFGLVIFAFAIMFSDTYLQLATGPWDTEQDGHGPFIIAITVLMYVWHFPTYLQQKGNPQALLGWSIILVSCFLFVISHSQEILLIDAGTQATIILGVILIHKGYLGLKILWFPTFFLLFSVPLPGWLLDAFTQPMKLFLSEFVTNQLFSLGYNIAQNGVTIYIDQYQLLVKDACVGLNSLISLSAVGIFYIYLVKPNKLWHTLLLLTLILPAAILANIIRVTSLVLITHYWGDEAGQGFLHDFSGLVMFLSALGVFLIVDGLIVSLSLWFNRRKEND